MNNESYQKFLENNPSKGFLNIRAYMGDNILPIEGVKINVIANIDNNKVSFYNGITDSSGMIDTISLPCPKNDKSNLESPKWQEYEVIALYEPNNFKNNYKVLIFENIIVIQNIVINPNSNMIVGDL